jgi:hypothetical protein
MRRTNKLLRALKGWEFDVKRLMETERGSEGASLSPPKVPRADITNVHPSSTKINYKWDHYSGLPGPEAYMER